jgi:hypothetical protein
MNARDLSKARLDRLTAFAVSQVGTELGADLSALLGALAEVSSPIKRWVHVPMDDQGRPRLDRMTVGSDHEELEGWRVVVGGEVVSCVDRDSVTLRKAAQTVDAAVLAFRAIITSNRTA